MFDGIREECDLTVFLDAPDGLLLARRLERDTKQRGYSVSAEVVPGAEKGLSEIHRAGEGSGGYGVGDGGRKWGG